MITDADQDAILIAKKKCMARVNYFLQVYADNISEYDSHTAGNVLVCGPYFWNVIASELLNTPPQSGKSFLFYDSNIYKRIRLKKPDKMTLKDIDFSVSTLNACTYIKVFTNTHKVQQLYFEGVETDWYIVGVAADMESFSNLMARPFVWKNKLHVSPMMIDHIKNSGRFEDA